MVPFREPHAWRGGSRFSGAPKWDVNFILVLNEQARAEIDMSATQLQQQVLVPLTKILTGLHGTHNKRCTVADLGWRDSAELPNLLLPIPATIPGAHATHAEPDGVVIGKIPSRFLRVPPDVPTRVQQTANEQHGRQDCCSASNWLDEGLERLGFLLWSRVRGLSFCVGRRLWGGEWAGSGFRPCCPVRARLLAVLPRTGVGALA